MAARGKPFPKGKSGNPGGRPRILADVRELAREHTERAVETLAGIMSDDGAAPAARVAAANALLDRGYGKPVQAVDAHIAGHVENPCALPRCETYEDWLKYVELSGASRPQ